jgi:hypothetical protein
VLVVSAVGLEDVSGWASRGDTLLGTKIFRAGAAVMLVLGALSTLRFASLYGELSGGIYRRDVAAARWIVRAMDDGRLPRHAVMADVVTSIEYLTGHTNINLHGVTSPAFFGNRPAEREAGVFESLSRLPKEARPGFLISSLATQDTYASLKAVVDEPPLFETTSGSDEIAIYSMRYDLVGKNARFFRPESFAAVEGRTEVDRLNVCDSSDESRHGYRFRSRLGDLSLNGTVRDASYKLPGGEEALLDGGRAIFGEETFEVKTRPGRDLVVILRTANSVTANVFRSAGPLSLGLGFEQAGFDVSINGEPWTRVAFRPREGWDEEAFLIPASRIQKDKTLLRLSGRYASFYYWFFQ